VPGRDLTVSNERLDALEGLASDHADYDLVTLPAGYYDSFLACRGERLILTHLRPSYKVYARDIRIAVSHYRCVTSNEMKARLLGSKKQ
jgi:hypothetical protein